MRIILKSKREIDAMRRAGDLGQSILRKMAAAAVEGVSTMELDQIAAAQMTAAGAKSGSLNYPTYKKGEGFPGWTCISVNEEVVHGIPGPRKLKAGDVVTLDVALSLDGYCADLATTVPIGTPHARSMELLAVTRETLELALKHIKPGKKWSEVARLMQHNVESHGFGVVREFVGHGVGRSMHEEPKVPNFATPEQLRSDFVLRPGMTFAVEPMVTTGSRDVVVLRDGWTAVTEDRKPAAHFEHTVAVTDTGVDVLTDGRSLV